MNLTTSQDKRIRIKAQYIGPVIELDGYLSSKSQNLIFATSGSGKSFLARGLRMLDSSAEDSKVHHQNPGNLVSEEGKVGTLTITEGNDEIAYLKLDTQSDTVECRSDKYLFHVFSTDYIETELKSKQFELDGNISHEIIIGRENKELDEKQEALVKFEADIVSTSEALKIQFNLDKSNLKSNFNINAGLSEYRSLDLRSCYEDQSQDDDLPSLQTVTQQYKSFRDLPQDAAPPTLPEKPSGVIDFNKLSNILTTPITGSNIAETVKQKISDETDFFETGLQLHQKESNNCPFCTQQITETAQHAIDTYIAYFEDIEAKTNTSLTKHRSELEQAKAILERFMAAYQKATNEYNKLKISFPSIEKTEIEPIDVNVQLLSKLYDETIHEINRKRKDLTLKDFSLSASTITKQLGIIAEIHKKNSELLNKLSKLIANSDSERLRIQRQACASFSMKFKNSKKTEFDELRKLSKEKKNLANQIETLKKTSGNKVSARTKVADTFQELMTTVFGGRYTFDKDRFVVQRNKSDMSRGGERTLSDGEKSVLAFCYFLAQTHLKIESLQDYERLFFVIDDPVSSVSFDYVYSICQIIKSLRIEDGELTFVGSSVPRPKMLLLTHHDYFYNVVGTNNIVSKDGLFQLVSKGSQHQINSQKGFVSPHIFHLKHVEAVTQGTEEPTFGTPNSIRSVLESMWKFTRPDLHNLGAFLSYVVQELELPLKSVLINDLSHGGKLGAESPLEEDIKTAAAEALAVVQKLAPGQLANQS